VSAPLLPGLRLPTSATNAAVAWSGVIALLATITVLNFWQPFRDIAHLALITMACTAIGVFVPDLLWQRIYRRALVAPTRAVAPAATDWPRVFTKFLGLLGSVGFVALLYRLFPEYRGEPSFYAHYWTALSVLLPVWAVLALPYLHWVDRRLAAPEDSLWQLGRLLLLRSRGWSVRVIGQHLLGWLVKGYFLPLMFTYFCDNLSHFLHYDPSRVRGFSGFYDWAYFMMYFVDVGLVSMTYLMSLKLTDTHIRSTEPTMLGWTVTLVCYQPLWSQIGGLYLTYDPGHPWGNWLSGAPWLYVLWGSLILALVAVYVWATIAFGGRFSNLTHRGIVTNGPYRFTKHPAYLTKNVSWWLLAMPFMVNTTIAEALRRSALLLLLNGIYYLRAKTEERHLSLDPVYRQYAQWIEAHGALRFLNRLPSIGVLARWRPGFRAYESQAVF
jgi:isoprenylcysteine carboxyl methyltransferase (ICMT) family protein YpbQ